MTHQDELHAAKLEGWKEAVRNLLNIVEEELNLCSREDAQVNGCAQCTQFHARLDALLPPSDGTPARPKIVCFCGSSRFVAEMAVLMWEWEKAGHISLGLHLMPAGYGEHKGHGESYDHLAELEGVAADMDELHKRKIDLADEVFVVNVKGYIGSSTRSEIEYARAHGKPVRFLEPESTPAREIPEPGKTYAEQIISASVSTFPQGKIPEPGTTEKGEGK